MSGLKWHREISFGQQPRGQSVREEIGLQKESRAGERAKEEEEQPLGAVGVRRDLHE